MTDYEREALAQGWQNIHLQGLLAVGSFVLAALAMWGDKLKRWLFAPQLRFYVNLRPSYCQRFPNGIWFRIRIGNEAATEASNGSVWIQEIYRGSEAFPIRVEVTPIPLIWAHEPGASTPGGEVDVPPIERLEKRAGDFPGAAKFARQSIGEVVDEFYGLRPPTPIVANGNFEILTSTLTERKRGKTTCWKIPFAHSPGSPERSPSILALSRSRRFCSPSRERVNPTMTKNFRILTKNRPNRLFP
jgi:hypothetical protein